MPHVTAGWFRRLAARHGPIERLRTATPLTDLACQERVSGLVPILEYALGTPPEAVGVPAEVLAAAHLPAPLARFYEIAGRRPSPFPRRAPVAFEEASEGYFYAGIQHVHLADADAVRPREDGRLPLFWEQSGNWVALAEPHGDDPAMWVQEVEGPDTMGPAVRSGEPLSAWLVAHSLAAIAWESANSLLAVTAEGESPRPADSRMVSWFQGAEAGALLLWRNTGSLCPELEGAYYLVEPGLVVHRARRLLRIAAVTEAAERRLRRMARGSPLLD